MKGTFILIIGPTGSGKSELIKHVRATFPDIVFPVSCTTRPPRPGEVDGQTYYFTDEAEFNRRIAAGEFLEWASIDGGRHYGTLKSEIVPALEAGKTVLREVEVQGAQQIQQLIPKENLAIIYIDAGSWDDLEQRIRGRAPISDDEVTRRRTRYEAEIPFKAEATYVVRNMQGQLESAKRELENIIRGIQAAA